MVCKTKENNSLISMFYIEILIRYNTAYQHVHFKPQQSNLWAYFSWCDHVLRWIDNDHLCSVEYKPPRKS